MRQSSATPSVLLIDHRCHTDLGRILLAPHPEGRLRLLMGQRTQFRLFEPDHDLALLQCLGTGCHPLVSSLSTTVAADFWSIHVSSWQHSDGRGIAIGVVLAWPIPIRRQPVPVPSPQDRRWGQTESLMVILSASLGLRAWWLHGDRSVDEIPIQLWVTHGTCKTKSMLSADERGRYARHLILAGTWCCRSEAVEVCIGALCWQPVGWDLHCCCIWRQRASVGSESWMEMWWSCPISSGR